MITINKYTGPEAALITGLPADSIRDHRRKGYLPKLLSGHPRYDLYELLMLGFVARCARRGIPLAEAYQSAQWVAHSALTFAIEAGAFEADFDFVRSAPALKKADATDEEVFDYAASRAIRAFGRPRIVVNRYACIWPDGRDFYAQSIEQVFASIESDDDRFGELAMVLDVAAFAIVVQSRLPRPAVVLGPVS